jgi:hypothetical protein
MYRDAYLIVIYLLNKLKMIDYNENIKFSKLSDTYFHKREISYILRKSILDRLFSDNYKSIPIYKKTQEELFFEQYQKKIAYEKFLERKRQASIDRKNYQRMLAMQFYNLKQEQLKDELVINEI